MMILRFLLIVTVLFGLIGFGSSLSDDEIRKMSVKQLKEFIKLRNLECLDCVEKSHLVHFVKEHKDVPIPQPKSEVFEEQGLEEIFRTEEESKQKNQNAEQQDDDNDVIVEDIDDFKAKFEKQAAKKDTRKNSQKKTAHSSRTTAGIWANKAKKLCPKYADEVADATAASIEKMEKTLMPVFAKTSSELKDMSLREPYKTMGVSSFFKIVAQRVL
jgi:hypothetical protein